MKTGNVRGFLLGILAAACVASSAPGQDQDTKAVADVSKSLESIAADVKAILVRERIHETMDFFRKMKDYGITYQPALTAPNDLVGRLDKDQLRLYAGIKTFDALYAVTFLKRQEAADCVAVIEQIQDALNLRSQADLGNDFLSTLKKAASQPDEVDVQKLIEQLASDYIQELPAMLSSTETADYFIDSLYGLNIQLYYIVGALCATTAGEQLQPGLTQLDDGSMDKSLLDVFEAFNRMDDTIRISGKTEEKLGVIRSGYDLVMAARNGTLSPEELDSKWREVNLTVDAIRNAILTPK